MTDSSGALPGALTAVTSFIRTDGSGASLRIRQHPVEDLCCPEFRVPRIILLFHAQGPDNPRAWLFKRTRISRLSKWSTSTRLGMKANFDP
jgi:hypothetical protein